MSSGRSRRPSKKINDDEIDDLISKLQALIPELRGKSIAIDRASTSAVLKQTCNYIRRLQREVDDMSQRLAQLLENMDGDSAQVEIIKNLLM